MKNTTAETIFGAAIIALLAAVCVAFYIGGTDSGYINGYCAALDGSVLNQTTCNVNGTVVEVQR